MNNNTINKPTMTTRLGGLTFDFVEEGVKIDVLQLKGDGQAELWIYSRDDSGEAMGLLDMGGK